LVKVKAIENLIIAISLLTKEDLNKIHLNIAGEGELFEDLLYLIKKENLESYITMHGYVDSNKQMFESNDIFILVSHQEGLSISLMEAMSFGMACIINSFGVPFSKGSVYEMINNNPDTIAQSIHEIINNPDLYISLSNNAYKEIQDNYSVESFSNGYCKAYEEILSA
jgi:glycosyltransferase involved in cell wall biosynthesis